MQVLELRVSMPELQRQVHEENRTLLELELDDEPFDAFVEIVEALALDARWDNWLSITPALCEDDDPRVALRGDEEGVYASEEFAETARFYCAWNDAHPKDRITLFAFRGMTPWRDAPALRSLFAELAGDDAASLEAGLATCTGATSTRDELYASYPVAMTREGHGACLAGLDAGERVAVDPAAALAAMLDTAAGAE